MARKFFKEPLKTAVVAALAEVVGTAILMFLGCMGSTTGFKPLPTPSIQGPLVFGMTVASIIQMLGHVSGAHLNPAVTCAAWVWGLTSLPLSIAYIVAQVAGATAGYGLLVAITPENILDLARNSTTLAFCGTAPSPGLTEAQSFFAEFLVTSLLILMCCGCWDKRNEAKQDSVAIKFGILVAAISLAEGPYTGGSMNPARTFAPAVFYNAWDSHWIYWVAPMSSGLIIAFLYKLIFTEKKSDVKGNTIEITNGNTGNIQDKTMLSIDAIQETK